MNRAGEIAAQNQFSLAHPEFYEAPSHYQISPEYLGRLQDLLPSGWAIRRDDVWLHALAPEDTAPGSRPVLQGFKIHVSSSLEHALRLLDIVVPVCARHSTSFKIAGDPTLLSLLNAKGQWRGISGQVHYYLPQC